MEVVGPNQHTLHNVLLLIHVVEEGILLSMYTRKGLLLCHSIKNPRKLR